MRQEGWYRDPYGLHEDRWFSAGRPTSLVRDENAESQDDPPPYDPPREPEPIPEPAGDNSNLLRADEGTRVDQEISPREIAQEAVDRSGELGTGFG